MMGLIVFTMFFGGGLIPSFLLVSWLGMLNTVWALLIPNAVAVYNLIICRTFFKPIFRKSFRNPPKSMAAQYRPVSENRASALCSDHRGHGPLLWGNALEQLLECHHLLEGPQLVSASINIA